jgi:hypothetical protein
MLDVDSSRFMSLGSTAPQLASLWSTPTTSSLGLLPKARRRMDRLPLSLNRHRPPWASGKLKAAHRGLDVRPFPESAVQGPCLAHMNFRKGAKIGQRQVDLANQLFAAGVFSSVSAI